MQIADLSNYYPMEFSDMQWLELLFYGTASLHNVISTSFCLAAMIKRKIEKRKEMPHITHSINKMGKSPQNLRTIEDIIIEIDISVPTNVTFMNVSTCKKKVCQNDIRKK